MNEVTELRIFVLQLENRILKLEAALEKERAQKAAAGKAGAIARWKPKEVMAAPSKTRSKKPVQNKDNLPVVMAAPYGTPSNPKPKPVSLLYELVEHWRAEYFRVYNTEAMKASKKEFGHAKFILGKCSEDFQAASALVTHFMNRRESWYVKKGHTLQILVGDIDRLWAELNNGQIISSHDAKRAELLEHNASVGSKPMAENPLDTFDNLVNSFMGGSNGNKGIHGAAKEALPSASGSHADYSESGRGSPVRIGSSKD